MGYHLPIRACASISPYNPYLKLAGGGRRAARARAVSRLIPAGSHELNRWISPVQGCGAADEGGGGPDGGQSRTGQTRHSWTVEDVPPRRVVSCNTNVKKANEFESED